jgi:spermidine/putrescine transport system permease protein
MKKVLAGVVAIVLAALYAPIIVMVVFSFNSSKYLRWTGFTFDWYERMAQNHDLHTALGNTILLALFSTLLSTLLGTLAALAARNPFRGKRLYTTLVSLPVMMPDIVLAIALLALFRKLDLTLSLVSAVIAHTTFNLSYVAIIVSARLQGLDRSLELAAQDLGATPRVAFWKVTFPALLPAIFSGAILAFTLSFDDFVITYFTAGRGNDTLPVLIFSLVRFHLTPEVNAVSTVILLVSLALIVASLKISRVQLSGRGEK